MGTKIEESGLPITQEFDAFRKLGVRLAELLDEDQWSECEAKLLALYRTFATLKAKNAALEKDAARYRRLRDHTEYPPGEVRDDLYVHVDSVHAMDKWALSGADLDAFLDREIDATIKEQNNPQESK